jgi:hypothetical protein
MARYRLNANNTLKAKLKASKPIQISAKFK